MNTHSLFGFGCACQQQAFGAVADYDIITIGGTKYTANQVLDKQLVASKPVALYTSGNFKTPFYTVPAGQPIGKVYSYIRASEPAGILAGGQLIMFYDSKNRAYYVKDDSAIDQSFLKDQGTLTVTQEIQKEQEEKEKDNDPISYYFKKLAMPVLIGAGVIYLVATYGKEFIKDKVAKHA